MAGGAALRHQPCCQPDLHPDSIRDAEPAVGLGGYSDRVGHDHLGGSGDLEALPLGRRGSGAVLHLGVDCDGTATEHHSDELGTVVARTATSILASISGGGSPESLVNYSDLLSRLAALFEFCQSHNPTG